MEQNYNTDREARKEEKKILDKYKGNKWTGISLLSDGNSEMFNIDILGLDNDKNKN